MMTELCWMIPIEKCFEVWMLSFRAACFNKVDGLVAYCFLIYKCNLLTAISYLSADCNKNKFKRQNKNVFFLLISLTVVLHLPLPSSVTGYFSLKCLTKCPDAQTKSTKILFAKKVAMTIIMVWQRSGCALHLAFFWLHKMKFGTGLIDYRYGVSEPFFLLHVSTTFCSPFVGWVL